MALVDVTFDAATRDLEEQLACLPVEDVDAGIFSCGLLAPEDERLVDTAKGRCQNVLTLLLGRVDEALHALGNRGSSQVIELKLGLGGHD